MATLRRTLQAPISAPLMLPLDVRLMNAVSATVFVVAAVAALVAGVLWLMRSPLFPIRAISLDGDLARSNVPTIRANAAPRLAGNFFSVDLQRSRQAFESVPWVRRAVVHRVWPDRLAVQLEEHRPAALWAGEDGASRLVNSHGEVFDANAGDLEDDSLGTLEGPDGSAAQMLAMLVRLQPVLARLELDVLRLHLSGRGSWRVDAEGGAVLELGRGSEEEVIQRSERFVRTLAAAKAAQTRRGPLEYADLRHRDGYAVRLRADGNAAATPVATGTTGATSATNATSTTGATQAPTASTAPAAAKPN